MSVIAFNFTKISGERKSGAVGKAQIKNQTSITDVQEAPLGKQPGLRFTFRHSCVYEPNLATLELIGEVIVLSTEAEAKDTLASFKKNKTFSPALTQKIYNTVLTRVSVESLILAKDLNLPAPVRLPRLEAKATAAKPEPKKK